MPENIQETKVLNTDKSNMKYADRDKWTGSPGSTAEEKTWINAPQNSTFVVISGTYSGIGSDGNTYTGNVSYTIHLGDFSNGPDGSMGNFSVERNSSYTYTITVKGVDKIIAEAKKKQTNISKEQKDRYLLMMHQLIRMSWMLITNKYI